MQSELKLVKEFRRKRAQMQKELDEVNFVHRSQQTCLYMHCALFLVCGIFKIIFFEEDWYIVLHVGGAF